MVASGHSRLIIFGLRQHMNSARTPKKPDLPPTKLENGSLDAEHVVGAGHRPDFKAIRKRISKRFPKTIEHLAK